MISQTEAQHSNTIVVIAMRTHDNFTEGEEGAFFLAGTLCNTVSLLSDSDKGLFNIRMTLASVSSCFLGIT